MYKRIRIILGIVIIIAVVLLIRFLFINRKPKDNNTKSITSKIDINKDKKDKEIKGKTNVPKDTAQKPSGDAQTANSNVQTANNNTQATDSNVQAPNSGSIDKDYAKVFKKDVFIGDSITEALAEYDILDEQNVCAKLGINLNRVDEQITKASSITPERIFLLLGSNDIEYNEETPQMFADRYRDTLRRIKEKMPYTKVYIQSILPVLPEASKHNSLVNNTRITEFNDAVKKMAEQENISYLDIASVLNESNKNLYEPDGEHFKIQFYSLWLNYIELNAK